VVSDDLCTRCDPLTVADACSPFVFVVSDRAARALRAALVRAGRFANRITASDCLSDKVPVREPRSAGVGIWLVWLLKWIQLDRIDPRVIPTEWAHERFI